MLNIVLFGPPGSGKGTQSDKIVEKYKLAHLSTGDILREEVKNQTETGKKAKAIMDKGELVSDSIVVEALENKTKTKLDAPGIVFDGFPRTIEQAERLDPMLAGAGRAVTRVILIDVPEDELVERLAGRRLCKGCGKGYHVLFDPPQNDGVCDVCGDELYQRSDDNEATVHNRLDVYRAQTEPLVGYYEARRVLKTAHGGGKMPDEVFAQVEQLLEGD